jgi:glucose/arabinose dehydrogenase
MLASLKLMSLVCVVLFTAETSFAVERFSTELHEIEVTAVVDGLRFPWGMAFLPDGDILVTERDGALRLVRGGQLVPEAIAGLPEIAPTGQGGLMGIALDPAFEQEPWVYLAYAGKGRGGHGTEVVRGRLRGMRLEDVEVLFTALPKSRGGRHFGSRLVFLPDGTLLISLGDRGERKSAQDLDDHRGSLIRINPDGSVPEDNPFAGGSKPEIFSYGHRNMQGLALHPDTGLPWTHEHGPQGGDEVNINRPGANYGWPVITYGVNYGIGTRIGEGTAKPGMEQPVHTWVPSIAPSGMAFYTGDQLPRWRGNLLVGSLKFGQLVRLTLDNDRVVDEERLLNNRFGRIRDVVMGPDGFVYLLTDSPQGQLLRVASMDP